MHKNLTLFQYKAKYAGVALLLLSLIFAYFYFLGGKPEIFNIKVFAILSVYLEKSTFKIIQTNVLDELAFILLIAGICLIVLSEEKKEEVFFNYLRMKAICRAIIVSVSIWIISILFVYGLPIFIASSSIFILFLISYYVIFKYYHLTFIRNNK